MKLRLRCKHCKFEIEIPLRLGPASSFKPGKKSPSIKLDKGSLDKLLERLGWEDAMKRLELRRFLRENLRITKERIRRQGERYVLTTRPWRPGDPFKDVSLPASEIKSFGIEDLRLIPGVTLQTKEYGIMKGREEEKLRGIKFLVVLDVSGSMIDSSLSPYGGKKIEMALKIAKETYEFCKILDYSYHLSLFSDRAVRIPDERIKLFFSDKYERASYRVWNGGTKLREGLKQFEFEEYKDANVVIISDMDIADLKETKDEIKAISQLTNSFKIILVEYATAFTEERLKEAKSLFPNEEVKILLVTV